MGTALDYLPAEDVYLALSRRRGAYGRVFAPGQTFWLDNSDSQTSDVAGRGSLFAPFKTLAFAISQCTTGNGDRIILKPGHDETLTAVLAISINDLTIEGEGWTSFRPVIRTDHTTGSGYGFTVTGTGVRIVNIRFVNQAGNLARLFNVGADGFLLAECEVKALASTDYIDDLIYLDGAAASIDDIIIEGNRFLMLTVATPFGDHAIVVRGGACNNLLIANNLIMGNWVDAVIDSNQSGYGVVRNNLYYQEDTSQYNVFAVGSMKICFDGNGGYSAHSTLNDHFNTSSAGGAFTENYSTNNLANAGAIVPTTRAS